MTAMTEKYLTVVKLTRDEEKEHKDSDFKYAPIRIEKAKLEETRIEKARLEKAKLEEKRHEVIVNLLKIASGLDYSIDIIKGKYPFDWKYISYRAKLHSAKEIEELFFDTCEYWGIGEVTDKETDEDSFVLSYVMYCPSDDTLEDLAYTLSNKHDVPIQNISFYVCAGYTPVYELKKVRG